MDDHAAVPDIPQAISAQPLRGFSSLTLKEMAVDTLPEDLKRVTSSSTNTQLGEDAKGYPELDRQRQMCPHRLQRQATTTEYPAAGKKWKKCTTCGRRWRLSYLTKAADSSKSNQWIVDDRDDPSRHPTRSSRSSTLRVFCAICGVQTCGAQICAVCSIHGPAARPSGVPRSCSHHIDFERFG